MMAIISYGTLAVLPAAFLWGVAQIILALRVPRENIHIVIGRENRASRAVAPQRAVPMLPARNKSSGESHV
jgi:hypothetical protein